LLESPDAMHHRNAIFCLLVSLLLNGCVSVEDVQKLEPAHMYEGPHRSPAELVTLSIVGQVGQVLVRGVDDVHSSFWGNSLNSAYVYILPGPHRLKVQYLHGTPMTGMDYTNEVDSEVEMLAGHTYAVHFELARDDKKVKFQLVDYGSDFPKKCIIFGIRDGGPAASSVKKCVMDAAKA